MAAVDPARVDTDSGEYSGVCKGGCILSGTAFRRLSDIPGLKLQQRMHYLRVGKAE